MGFVKQAVSKLTGADQEADALNRAASEQADATRKAADMAANAAREAAQQTATQQAESAARATALAGVAATNNVMPENPVVNIADAAPAGAAKKRRQKFGIGSSNTGVNI
jgi:hypothetical protein